MCSGANPGQRWISWEPTAGATGIVITIVLVFTVVKVFTGLFDEGIKFFTGVVSAGLVGAVAMVFGPIFKDWFANGERSSPGTVKILVYGHSGSGKSTFIENALAYEEARPPETFDSLPPIQRGLTCPSDQFSPRLEETTLTQKRWPRTKPTRLMFWSQTTAAKTRDRSSPGRTQSFSALRTR